MFKTINGGTLPKRQTRYSSGFDVFANEDKVIGAGCTELIGLGIALDIEIKNNEFQIQHYKRNASSHFLELHIDDRLAEKGLIAPPKIVNLDCIDEIKMAVHNPICGYENVEHYEHGTIAMPYGASRFKGELNQAYKIYKGDKIGQLILKRHEGYLLPQEYTIQN